MSKFDIASEMNSIMSDASYQKIFAKPTPQFAKTAAKKEEKKEDKKEDKKKLDKEEKKEKKEEKVVKKEKAKKKAMSSFEVCVKGLSRISEVLDASGFEKAATFALLSLDSLVSTAEEKEDDMCVECDEDESDAYDKETAYSEIKDEPFPMEKETYPWIHDEPSFKDLSEEEVEGGLKELPDESWIDRVTSGPLERIELDEEKIEPSFKDLSEEEIEKGTEQLPASKPQSEWLQNILKERNVKEPSKLYTEIQDEAYPEIQDEAYPEIQDISDEEIEKALSMLDADDGKTEEDEEDDCMECMESKSASAVANLIKMAKELEKKKNPKAAIRNKKAPIFDDSHPKVKDDKDHFPIDTIGRARNALARVNQFSKAPSWWSGSLESLQSTVVKAVHKKYPSIDISEKAKTPKKK